MKYAGVHVMIAPAYFCFEKMQENLILAFMRFEGLKRCNCNLEINRESGEKPEQQPLLYLTRKSMETIGDGEKMLLF